MEFTDEFLQLYNTAIDQTKREKLELKAAKLLEKLKVAFLACLYCNIWCNEERV